MNRIITVDNSDTLFFTSPDCGADCFCSRCGKAIYNIAILVYYNELNAERRYHAVCQGIQTDENDFEPRKDEDFDIYDSG